MGRLNTPGSRAGGRVCLFVGIVASLHAGAVGAWAQPAVPKTVSPVESQSDDPRATLTVIQDLLARIGALERRIAELEGRLQIPEKAQADPRADQQPDAPGRHEEHVSDLSPSLGSSPLFKLQGFGDIGFRSADLSTSQDAFRLGQIDLFVTSRLADNVDVLGELVFETRDDATYTTSFERLLVQYAPNDLVRLAAGRYHSAFGYYTTAYHHGTFFQTAVGWPTIYTFGGVLPIHGVGISASGRVPSGPLGLHYTVELDASVKVLRLDGLAPGDPEYVLRLHGSRNGDSAATR